MTTIQSMVINVDTKINDMQIDLHDMKSEIVDMKSEIVDMKSEIVDMKAKIESSKSEVLVAVDRKVDCSKAEIVNSIHDQMKKIDKISEVFVKIVASQNTLSSSLKAVARNLPQRDLMMNKHELSQSLAEINLNIQRNNPVDKHEMVGHLQQLKDLAEQLPQQGQIMMKQELTQQFNDIREIIQEIKDSQGATGG